MNTEFYVPLGSPTIQGMYIFSTGMLGALGTSGSKPSEYQYANVLTGEANLRNHGNGPLRIMSGGPVGQFGGNYMTLCW